MSERQAAMGQDQAAMGQDQAEPSRGPHSLVERLMAVSETERDFIIEHPKLRREIGFQALALILCPVSFGFAVFKVAIYLLGYAPPVATALAGMAALMLFMLDQHYLIQARGNASPEVQRAVLKVRIFSIMLISLSFGLMASYTFHADIDRLLAEAKEAKRAELAQSPKYAQAIASARAALERAEEAQRAAADLRAEVLRLQVLRASALQNMRNELEGNIINGKQIAAGYGPKARGYQAAAERLGREIQAVEQRLVDLGDAPAQVAEARGRLAKLARQIDAEVQLAVNGPSRRLDALGQLLQSSFSACLAVCFWMLIGMLPDLLMFAAQRRSFNHELFRAMRAVEEEDMQANIAHLCRRLRQRQADRLAPLEVRIAAVPKDAAFADQDGPSRPANTGDQA